MRGLPFRAALVLRLEETPPGSLTGAQKLRMLAETLASYPGLAVGVRRGWTLPGLAARARAVGFTSAVSPTSDVLDVGRRLGFVCAAVVDRLPTDSRCLVKSLVLLRLLARRGVEARLVVGVRAEAGFASHAWVEFDGTPLLPSRGYERLLEL